MVTRGQIIFLGIWIFSLTYSFDIVSEFKPFDIIAVVGILAYSRAFFPGNWVDSESGIDKWTGLYVLCAFWGFLVTIFTAPETSWIYVVGLRFYRFLGYIALFYILRYLPFKPAHLKSLVNIIFLAGVFQAVLICLQKFGFVETFEFGAPLRGTLEANHVNAVTFMTVGISAALVNIYLEEDSRFRRLAMMVSILAMAFAMVLSEARGAFVVLGVLVIAQVKKIKGFITVVAAIFMLLIIQNVTDYNFFEEGQNIFQDRLVRKMNLEKHYRGYLDWDLEAVDKGRAYIWKSTLEILKEKPIYIITGAGFQNFQTLRSTTSAHNNFLHILAELGIVGVVVFAFWLRALWRMLRKWKFIDDHLYLTLSFSGLACFWGVFTITLFNEPLYAHRNSPGFLAYFMAFCVVLSHRGWLEAIEEENAVPEGAAVREIAA